MHKAFQPETNIKRHLRTKDGRSKMRKVNGMMTNVASIVDIDILLAGFHSIAKVREQFPDGTPSPSTVVTTAKFLKSVTPSLPYPWLHFKNTLNPLDI